MPPDHGAFGGYTSAPVSRTYGEELRISGPDPPAAAARRSDGTASRAAGTRRACPNSIHASPRHFPSSPSSSISTDEEQDSSRGGTDHNPPNGKIRVEPSPPTPGVVLYSPCRRALQPESSSASCVRSPALSGSRTDHFTGEMTNQSHYYPINMMEEVSFQTHAPPSPAQPAGRPVSL